MWSKYYNEIDEILQDSVLQEGEDPLSSSSVAKFEDWIAEKIEVLLFQSSNTNTLIIGRYDAYYVLIVGKLLVVLITTWTVSLLLA